MKNIIENAEQYVRNLLREQLPTTFFYHNINHNTLNVIEKIKYYVKPKK